MTKNIFREKILSHQPLCGTHIQLPVAEHGEIMGLAGFDYIWIDNEHSPIPPNILLQCINLVKMSGTAAIVRVPVNDYNATKKVLEMGPDGIVFPMINTKALAEDAVASTLYPPYGTRGFGPMRAVRYGLDDTLDYINEGCFELARLAQLETVEAVENLDDILTVDHLDGFIIGPMDLAASVGELGKAEKPVTMELIETIGNKLSAAGKSFGVSIGGVSDEMLKFYVDLGATLISTGVDFGYLLDSAIATRQRLRRIYD